MLSSASDDFNTRVFSSTGRYALKEGKIASYFGTFVASMNKLLLLTVLLFLTSGLFAQSPKLDSLERLFDETDSPVRKVKLAIELGRASADEKEKLAYAALAEELSESLSSRERAEMWSGSARLYSSCGKPEEAIERQQKTVTLFSNIGDKLSKADALFRLADYQQDAAHLDAALNTYEEAQALYRDLENTEGVIDCLNQIGVIHKDLANYTQALPIYYEAYDLARKNGLANKLASTCVNIGVVLKNQRQFDEALSYYRRAEEIYIIDSDHYGLADIYNNIGNVQRQQEKFSDALKSYKLALEHRKRSGRLERLSYTYNNIGIVYTQRKQYDKAIEYLTLAEDEKIKYKDYQTLSHTYLNMSEVYLGTNNEPKYHYYADLADKLARKYSLMEIVRNVQVNNGKFEAQNGNYEKAYAYLSGVFNAMDTLDEQSEKVLTSVLQAHFREKQNQSEISQLSEANTTLSYENKELEEQQHVSRVLIWALSIVLFVLIGISILLLRNQRALWEKKRQLELTNEQLRETTIGKEEKETLLKEIHHRVKNNLQIIKSLIRLQKAGMEDQGMNDQRMSDILQEFEQRVSSMALVHESLYKSKDLASVDVSSYYENLINDLIAAYNVSQDIRAEIAVNISGLGLDTLVPLGLLTNEIISNSLKHGFEEGQNGIITVDLEKIDEDNYVLYIGDNGKGFDFDEQRSSESTLGTELILALVEQLDGTYEFINMDGSYYKITFKPQEKTTR